MVPSLGLSWSIKDRTCVRLSRQETAVVEAERRRGPGRICLRLNDAVRALPRRQNKPVARRQGSKSKRGLAIFFAAPLPIQAAAVRARRTSTSKPRSAPFCRHTYVSTGWAQVFHLIRASRVEAYLRFEPKFRTSCTALRHYGTIEVNSK